MNMNIKGAVSNFVGSSVRILKLTKKPDKEEFFFVAKITGLGIMLIGFIGYVIQFIRVALGG